MYKLEKENEKIILLKKKYLKNDKKIIYINFRNIIIFNFTLNYKYIFLILLIIYFIKIEVSINNNEIEENEILNKDKSRNYLKIKMINKFNSYIKKCHNSNLFNKRSYILYKKPKISVILPIYNGGQYLCNSLTSIQNQNMEDIEIILIDDFSSDNSIIVIEEYMKQDPRIRLIKNNKNKKILYSKSIGALNSKGEYIIQLDQDDMFIRDDAFRILYYEAKKYNLDLIQMRDIIKNNFVFQKKTLVNQFGFHLIYPKKNHYKTHPEFKDKLFTENNNYLLWGILIKTDLYKNAIYNLWPLIMNYKIIFNEDYIITSMLVKLAKKYKYINKFILIHLIHSKSISNDHFNNNEFYLTLYFYIYYLYEYYVKNSPRNINIIINYIYTNSYYFSKGINLFPKMFDSIIRIILNNDYLSLEKKKIFFNKLNIDINNYEKFNTYKYLMNEKEYKEIINFHKKNSNYNIKKEIINNLINIKYKITIIIYCFDLKFLSKTIYSILNQINIINEILIIFDNNNNKKNIKYINNLINKYNNIKLIKNKEFKGKIYSYSIGVLNAKGKYILPLQPGYTLAKENILSYLNNLANENNLDILEFNILIENGFNIQNSKFKLYKCLHFQKNKDLDIIKINEKYKDINQEKELLFNKLIKTNIYKKIIYKYKLNKLNIKIINFYDNILIFLLNKYKTKFKHIDEFGIIQNKNNIIFLEKKNIINDKYQLINDSIFYINFLFDNSENTFLDKKYVFHEFINILSIIFNKFIKIRRSAIKLIEKFNKCKFINIEDKNELIFFYNSLIN